MNIFETLQHNRDVASLESVSITGIAAAVSNIVPSTVKSVQGLFDQVQNFVTSQVAVRFSGDKGLFLHNLSRSNYMSVAPLEVFIPEGMSVSWSVYLDALTKATEAAEKLPYELSEYETLIAGFTANHDNQISTDYVEKEVKELESVVDGVQAELKKCFTPGSTKTTSKIKEVVKNNSEWNEVFNKIELCQERLDKIDREKLFKSIKRCSGVLDILERQAKSGHLTELSGDMLRKFSDYTLIIAKYLELYSIVYHMVSVASTAIGASVKKVNDVLR